MLTRLSYNLPDHQKLVVLETTSVLTMHVGQTSGQHATVKLHSLTAICMLKLFIIFSNIYI